MSCGAGRRRGSDLALLWLWHRPVATALIRPLAWETPYAAGGIKTNPPPKKKMFPDNKGEINEGEGEK